MSTHDVKTIVKKFADRVRTKYPVEKIYLFGSYAKNRADETSDIDVCVVSPSFGVNYSDEEMELIRMAVKFDSRISPVPYSPRDIQDKFSQLAHEITTYGISL